MISIYKITKGHDSVKYVDGVMVLVLCASSDNALYLYQVSRKYLKSFLSYGLNTISILKITKGA